MKILSKMFLTILSLTLVGGMTISCKKDKPKDPVNPVNPVNGGEKKVVELNVDGTELPALYFGMDMQVKTIVEHEKAVGRTEKDGFHIPEFGDIPIMMYQNSDLTIPMVMYGLQDRNSKFLKTYAFCKEEVNNCPKLLEMMKKAGFPESEIKDNIRQWVAATENYTLTVRMESFDPGKYAKELEPYAIKTQLTFSRIPNSSEYSGKFLHELIVDARDIPPYTIIGQGLDGFERYETDIPMRNYCGQDDSHSIAASKTKKEWLNRSNLFYVDYYFHYKDSKPFFEMELNCFKTIDELKTSKVVDWLANNGYHLIKDDSGQYWSVINHNDTRTYFAETEEGYTVSIRCIRESNKILLQIFETEYRD